MRNPTAAPPFDMFPKGPRPCGAKCGVATAQGRSPDRPL